jgi:hypothetical protein
MGQGLKKVIDAETGKEDLNCTRYLNLTTCTSHEQLRLPRVLANTICIFLLRLWYESEICLYTY